MTACLIALAVVLTGMGQDGTAGAVNLARPFVIGRHYERGPAVANTEV